MYILGLVGGARIGYQDASAALLKDGKIVRAVEEERLLRQKHAAGQLPELSVRWLLDSEGIEMRDIDCVVTHGISWTPDFKPILSSFLKSKFGHSPAVELVDHHEAHCASAFCASGFEEAMTLSMDLSGDGSSTCWAIGSSQTIKIIRRNQRPNSLGVFYAAITEYCGFLKDSDEYKLMGLSSYGDRNSRDFSWFVQFGDGQYELNSDYVQGFKSGEASPSKQIPIYSDRFIREMGRAPRRPHEPMTKFYEDVAAAAQNHLENIIVELVTEFHRETGLRKLCLAGGVALNVVANQRLMELDFIDEIYVQPAANDSGIALGAAYLGCLKRGIQPLPMENAYLGPSVSGAEMENALKMTGTPYKHVDNPAIYAAEAVSNGKIVGWFQGEMEFGPRALGNRSILANPCKPGMQDIVNEKVKFRETYRPFCPSVIEDEMSDYFKGGPRKSPYMTFTFDVIETQVQSLPAVTHVDNTARIQTVDSAQNELFFSYLNELKKRIGCGVTMNTSFNVKGDPIVNTPYQALSTFWGSGMDTLVMGGYAIEKPKHGK